MKKKNLMIEILKFLKKEQTVQYGPTVESLYGFIKKLLKEKDKLDY